MDLERDRYPFSWKVWVTGAGRFNDELEGYSFHETAVYFKKRFELPLTIEEIMETWNHMASEIYVNEIPLKMESKILFRY